MKYHIGYQLNTESRVHAYNVILKFKFLRYFKNIDFREWFINIIHESHTDYKCESCDR